MHKNTYLPAELFSSFVDTPKRALSYHFQYMVRLHIFNKESLDLTFFLFSNSRLMVIFYKPN